MKFENKPPTKEEVEVHAQKEIEKERKFVGNITPFKGHTLFEINCTTGNIVEAEYETEAIDFKAATKGFIAKKKKVITKENCLYVSCLNRKNAEKKYLNWLLRSMKHKLENKGQL